MHTQNGVNIPDYDFSGKVAVVTGGGSGIGFAAATQLAYYGAKVVIAGVPAAQCEAAAGQIGGSCVAIPTDVSDPEAVDALIAETVRRFGKLDILICCAGIGGEVLPLLEQSKEELD